MNKKNSLTILIIISLHLILTGAGCPGEFIGPEFEWEIPVTVVPHSDSILVGDTLTLSATIPDSISGYGKFSMDIEIGMESDTGGINYFNIETVVGQYNKNSLFHTYRADFSESGNNESLRIILIPREEGKFSFNIRGDASRIDDPRWSNVWFYFDSLKSPDEEYVYGVHNVKYYVVTRIPKRHKDKRNTRLGRQHY